MPVQRRWPSRLAALISLTLVGCTQRVIVRTLAGNFGDRTKVPLRCENQLVALFHVPVRQPIVDDMRGC